MNGGKNKTKTKQTNTDKFANRFKINKIAFVSCLKKASFVCPFDQR